MDKADLIEWTEFCEGKRAFPQGHFSRLFMEFFLDPLSEEDRRNLAQVMRYLPNSARLLKQLLRIDEVSDAKSESQLSSLVISDLLAKKSLLGKNVVGQANVSRIVFTPVESDFLAVRDGTSHGRLLHSMNVFFAEELLQQPVHVRAMSDAFYGIASNLQLQWSLTADLLGVRGFAHYFELYLAGADYAIGEKSTTVIDYRTATTV